MVSNIYIIKDLTSWLMPNIESLPGDDYLGAVNDVILVVEKSHPGSSFPRFAYSDSAENSLSSWWAE